jgi:hypothetical protein
LLCLLLALLATVSSWCGDEADVETKKGDVEKKKN